MPLLSPSANSLDLSLLEKETRLKVQSLIKLCSKNGVEVRPFSALRGPKIQGEMWCRSRTQEEVWLTKCLMERSGAPKLASFLKEEMALQGRWATDRLPGQSWHQFGEACDFVLIVGSKAIWQGSFYSCNFGDLVDRVGLNPGARWLSRKDLQHVQLRKELTPLYVAGKTTWAEVEEKMSEIYEL